MLSDSNVEENILEIPPDIDLEVESSLFDSYPDWSLPKIKERMKESNGKIDFSNNQQHPMINISATEFTHFTKTILSLNLKKYPLRNMNLNNCELTDKKLAALAPLLSRFHWVTLNGHQKISRDGWVAFSENILKVSSKINKLELKFAKSQAIDFKRRLEELEEMASNQPNCEINDEVMEILAPGFVRIKEVHLGQISLSLKGWKVLKNALTEKSTDPYTSPIKLSILNLSQTAENQIRILGETKYIQDSDMEELSYILLKMEKVSLSGQKQIGKFGWEKFSNIILETKKQNSGNDIRLKTLDVNGCHIDDDTFKLLENTLKQINPNFELIHNKENMSDDLNGAMASNVLSSAMAIRI